MTGGGEEEREIYRLVTCPARVCVFIPLSLYEWQSHKCANGTHTNNRRVKSRLHEEETTGVCISYAKERGRERGGGGERERQTRSLHARALHVTRNCMIVAVCRKHLENIAASLRSNQASKARLYTRHINC